MGYKKEAWLEMFRHATKDDYAFMYLNSKRPRELRIMKNFDKVLFSKAEGDEETFDGEQDAPEEKKKKIK